MAAGSHCLCIGLLARLADQITGHRSRRNQVHSYLSHTGTSLAGHDVSQRKAVGD